MRTFAVLALALTLTPALRAQGKPATAGANAFTLTSPTVRAGGRVPAQSVFNSFGCSGGNVSPELHWTARPGAKSYAVTVYDPDAPTGSGWWHWVIVNIPANVTYLAAGAGDPSKGTAPAGSLQTRTDFGAPGYGGPCPPKGDAPHRYIFTVYALKVEKLDVDQNASGAMVGFNIHANQLGTAQLIARYGH